MKTRLFVIVIMLAMMTVTHFAAIVAGLYEGRVWVDIPLHFMGGIVLGLISLLIGQRLWKWWPSSRFAASAWIVAFAGCGSLLWEAFEFALWVLFPALAEVLKFYSPTVSDFLTDVAAGLVGGISVAGFRQLR